MHLNKILELIEYKIKDGAKFMWSSLGENSRIFSFENNIEKDIGSLVVTLLGEVVEIEVMHEKICYRWVNENFKRGYFEEGDARNIDMTKMDEELEYIDLDTQEDILSKLEAIYQNIEFDKLVELPIDMNDTEFLMIAKMAHEKDITFNEQVNLILKTIVKERKFEQKTDILYVQEDEKGDLFLEFPPELIAKTNWKIGDKLIWTQNLDGAFELHNENKK